MVREISSGGVVVRQKDGEWWMAAIELPEGPPVELDLNKREVREETGITASVITKLADIKYVYVRSWGDKEKVFKIVSFYLLRYASGRIDHISEDMRIEVARAKWVKLEDAPKLLAYRGEKQMAKQALEYVKLHAPELSSGSESGSEPLPLL